MDEIKQHTYRVLRILLRYLKRTEVKSSEIEMDNLWRKIEAEALLQRRDKHKRKYYLYIGVAASVLVLFTIGYLFDHFNSGDLSNELVKYAELTKRETEDAISEVKLLLSDQEEVLVKENSNIVYSQSGSVAIDKELLSQQNNAKKQSVFNQIVTPKGKRAQITLSDGTKMWVNTGTRVIYPNVFGKTSREIFVEGEVYLDVSHIKEAPFIINTSDFKVQVLGTKFNISSYHSEPSSSVVLVEGSVRVENQDKEEVILQPNQLVNIQSGTLDTPVNVDVRKYISWIEDLLIYEDEPLSIVLKKLELYYGKSFVYSDIIDSYRVSGKLDLKDKLEDVLHTISFTLPVYFKEIGSTIHVEVVTK